MQAQVLTANSREEWRDVPGFECLYSVSNDGQIFSYPRNGTKGGILKQYEDRYGYLKVVLYKNDKPHYFTVHRLVAMTFVSNPYKKKTVNHIDGNKKNNYYKNLEWVSNKENLEHSFKIGLQNNPKQPIIAKRLSDGKIFRFPSHKEAARQLGLYQANISRALKNKKVYKGYLFEREYV